MYFVLPNGDNENVKRNVQQMLIFFLTLQKMAITDPIFYIFSRDLKT